MDKCYRNPAITNGENEPAASIRTHQLCAGLKEYPVTAGGKLFTLLNLLCWLGFFEVRGRLAAAALAKVCQDVAPAEDE